MTQTYLSVVTAAGQALLAAAIAGNTTVNLTTMSIGDGDGAPTTPDVGQTELVNAVYSAAITSLSVDPTNPGWMQAELVVPVEEGGWTAREIGLLAGSTLFAVANFPDTYKPLVAEGVARELTVRLVFQIASTAVVNITVNPSTVVLTQAAAMALIQSNSARVFAAAGGPNVWTGALTPIPTTLIDGMEVLGSFAATNTAGAPATLNLNSLGAKPLVLEDGTALPVGEMPATALLTYRAAGGGKFVVVNPARGAGFGGVRSVASAASVNLGAQGSHLINITGTTGISAFGSSANLAAPLYVVTFAAALTLTHNATSLDLPTDADIVTAAGDTALMLYKGSGNWQCLFYFRTDGSALSNGSGGSPGGFGAITSVASGATVDLGLIASHFALITGTTAITSLGSSANTANPKFAVRFSNALTLTHNGASLILPGGGNITTAPGDYATFEYLGSGNWKCNGYTRASGLPVVNPTYAIPPYGGYGAISAYPSASTVDIGGMPSHYINITGTTTILSLGSGANVAAPSYRVRFSGVLTLTHNATSLQLPNSANITTAAGDVAEFEYLGSGNWKCISYSRTNGQALFQSANPISTLTLLQSWTWSSNTQSVAFSSIPATGGRLFLEVNGLRVDAGGSVNIRVSSNGGSTSATVKSIASLSANDYLDLALVLDNYTGKKCVVAGNYTYGASATAALGLLQSGFSNGTGAVALSAPINYLACVFSPGSTGNISAGQVNLYVGS